MFQVDQTDCQKLSVMMVIRFMTNLKYNNFLFVLSYNKYDVVYSFSR